VIEREKNDPSWDSNRCPKPVRLEGISNPRLASEWIITEANNNYYLFKDKLNRIELFFKLKDNSKRSVKL
jgi:hypothetical protein